MNAIQPYREPTITLVRTTMEIAFTSTCPACGVERTKKCARGHTPTGEYEMICGVRFCTSKIVETTPLTARACGPEHPHRWGFLWLRRCRLATNHLHVRCRLCGWRGVMQHAHPGTP